MAFNPKMPYSADRANEVFPFPQRRRTARFPAGNARVLVRWHVEQTVRIACAHLINIGHGGAYLVAESFPEGTLPSAILIALADPWTADWVESAVVEVTDAPGGQRHIRLEFLQTCPERFLKAVIPPSIPQFGQN